MWEGRRISNTNGLTLCISFIFSSAFQRLWRIYFIVVLIRQRTELANMHKSGSYFQKLIFLVIWCKNICGKWRSKSARLAVSTWNSDPWGNFCDPHWEVICSNKWHPGTLGIIAPLEIAVGTHFYAWHGTKTTMVFLSPDTIRRHSATRKNVFLYPQGDKSGVK